MKLGGDSDIAKSNGGPSGVVGGGLVRVGGGPVVVGNGVVGNIVIRVRDGEGNKVIRVRDGLAVVGNMVIRVSEGMTLVGNTVIRVRMAFSDDGPATGAPTFNTSALSFAALSKIKSNVTTPRITFLLAFIGTTFIITLARTQIRPTTKEVLNLYVPLNRVTSTHAH